MITEPISMSVEAQPDGRISLMYHVRDEDGQDFSSHKLVVSYETAVSLIENLTSVVLREGEKRVRNTAAGDCATCRNHRMVDVPSRRLLGGQSWQEHCPDCWDRYANASPSYPTWTAGA